MVAGWASAFGSVELQLEGVARGVAAVGGSGVEDQGLHPAGVAGRAAAVVVGVKLAEGAELTRHEEGRLDAAVEWRPWPRLWLALAGAHERGDDVPLPPRWETDTTVSLAKRTGYGDGSQTHMWVDLRYGLFR